jgi:uncharacterized membrane protein YdjX (TVP38/TMEM64 family)
MKRSAKLGVVGLVLIVLASAWRFGVFAHLGDPKALADALVEMGGWGYLAFIVAYTVLQPFGVPGTVFVFAAPLIWPWQTAFALSMIGTMSASVVGFSFARFIARDWVSGRIPPWLRKYDAALERRALQTVVLLRMIFWMPQVLHFFLGLSKVPFWTHFWGSLIGYVPPLLLVSYVGAELFEVARTLRPDAWPLVAGLLAAALVIGALARAWLRRRRVQPAVSSPEDPPLRGTD